jgi:hypothetical protein
VNRDERLVGLVVGLDGRAVVVVRSRQQRREGTVPDAPAGGG